MNGNIFNIVMGKACYTFSWTDLLAISKYADKYSGVYEPESSVPNSFKRSVSASLISTMPWAGIATCDLCLDKGIVMETWNGRWHTVIGQIGVQWNALFIATIAPTFGLCRTWVKNDPALRKHFLPNRSTSVLFLLEFFILISTTVTWKKLFRQRLLQKVVRDIYL